jgi:lipopolysaccharide export LptBFGC system permease protein LptF
MRLPWLIWRFLLADLIRLGILATAALVGLIAFAFAVRFLAEGRIDVAGAVRLMAMAVVPMLQYALPFACGFAATLAYHRFAADNEATAASAGGISHRRVLAPALFIGLLLSAGLFFMAHQVIPLFLRSIEQTVTRDLTGVFVRAIERGEAVRLGAFEIHASEVAKAGPDPAVGATERLRLRGVLAAQVTDAGEVRGYVSADEVGVWLFEQELAGENIASAQLVFKGASGEGQGDLIQGGTIASQRVRIPSTFVDDPKYLTYQRLAALRTNPESIPRVDQLRRGLQLRLRQQEAFEIIRSELRTRGNTTLARLGGERLELAAADLRDDAGRWLLVSPEAGTVTITRRLASGSALRVAASAAWIEPEDPDQGPTEGGALLRLVYDPTARVSSAESAETESIPALSPQTVSVKHDHEDATPTVSAALAQARDRLAAPGIPAREQLATAAKALAARVADLQREVTSKMHERAAYALACLFIMLCGAITALRRQSSLPLPVYLWSFFPALASVITISAGQGLTHKEGPLGLILLWGGVAALALYVAREYARLYRH